MDDLRERLMRAADAADRAALPGFPTGPMSERWMNEFVLAIAQEGLRVVVDDDEHVWLYLTAEHARRLYEHTGTMPWAPGSWSNGVRAALSEALHESEASRPAGSVSPL